MMVATAPEAVTLGETMAVLTSPVGVSLRMAPSLDLSIAGAESNVAIGLARLGIATAWWGRVGDDELGRLILAKLAGEGVNVAGAIIDRAAPTGVMFKERRAADLVRVSYYRRDSAGSRFGASDVPDPLPPSARHLHLSGITPALSDSCRQAVNRALTAARAAGLTVSFDVNYRAALWHTEVAGQVLRELACRADIVFATRPEAELLKPPGLSDPRAATDEELCRSLTELGPAEAVLKLGSEGALTVAEGATHAVPAETAPIVDLVGAGDAFVSGYLFGYLSHAAPAERLTTAVRTAAFALAAAGDWEGLPSRSDLEQWRVAADGVHR
jgi:2-dehydro-3-deoxygluconokinase